MRFTSELAESEIAKLDDVPGPYWVQEAKRVSPRQFVLQQAATSLGKQVADVSDSDINAHNTLTARIKWMLKVGSSEHCPVETRS